MLERLKDTGVISAIVLGVTIAGCESNDPFATASNTEAVPTASADTGRPALGVRVYSSPYEAVDWATDRRLLAQHHDHVARRLDWVLAYDAAGYDVLSVMDYSGNPDLPYALKQRPWPAAEWIPQSAIASFKHIELLLPNGEEVGIPGEPMKHATSPFMTTYVEGAQKPPPGTPEQPLQQHQYRAVEDLFTLVTSLGGFPCLAHPWNFDFRNMRLGNSYCIEVYNAQADLQRERGLLAYYRVVDRNQTVITAWDEVLTKNQAVFGIAVNDHVGPAAFGPVSARVRDSGKIVVLAKDASRPEYERAFRSGSFFAVRDYGETKNAFPTVQSIAVTEVFIYVETMGIVRWIADGKIVGNDPLLAYASIPLGVRYVRAEISNADDSIVYTQAFAVRPIGDVDGDTDINANDEAVCTRAAATRSLAESRACVAAGLIAP